jgi:hypothetical protein
MDSECRQATKVPSNATLLTRSQRPEWRPNYIQSTAEGTFKEDVSLVKETKE